MAGFLGHARLRWPSIRVKSGSFGCSEVKGTTQRIVSPPERSPSSGPLDLKISRLLPLSYPHTKQAQVTQQLWCASPVVAEVARLTHSQ